MHIDIDVTTHIPDETASGAFDTNGRLQRLSSVHMQGLMRSADDALHEALDRGLEVSPYQQFKYDILNSPRLAYHDGKTFIDGGGIYRRIGDGLVIFTDVDFLLPSHAHHFEVKRAGMYNYIVFIDSSIYQCCPALSEITAHCRFAVDDEFATDTTIVTETSSLAIIPPVSGGA